MFELYSFVGLVVFWRDDSEIGGHTLKREIYLAIQCAIIPFLIYKDVVYLYFSIIYVGVGP